MRFFKLYLIYKIIKYTIDYKIYYLRRKWKYYSLDNYIIRT